MDRELELEVICGTYEEFVVGYQLFTYSGHDKVISNRAPCVSCDKPEPVVFFFLTSDLCFKYLLKY